MKLEELTLNLKEGIKQIQGRILDTTDQIADLKAEVDLRDEKIIEMHDERVAFQRKLREINNHVNELRDILGVKDSEIVKKDQAAIKMMEEVTLFLTSHKSD